MSHAYLNGTSRASNQLCNKVGYETRREALQTLRKHRPATGYTAHGSGKLIAFKCRQCGLFHLRHE